MTGNVIDFAVAVILAGAIGLVINGFVSDVMMPVVGSIFGNSDFSDYKYVLSAATTDADGTVTPENAILWGKWVTSIINLITVGLVLFFMVRAYNKTKAPVAEEAAGPTQEDLLGEIRDLLKK